MNSKGMISNSSKEKEGRWEDFKIMKHNASDKKILVEIFLKQNVWKGLINGSS